VLLQPLLINLKQEHENRIRTSKNKKNRKYSGQKARRGIGRRAAELSADSQRRIVGFRLFSPFSSIQAIPTSPET
jgi:hypothetical protein